MEIVEKTRWQATSVKNRACTWRAVCFWLPEPPYLLLLRFIQLPVETGKNNHFNSVFLLALYYFSSWFRNIWYCSSTENGFTWTVGKCIRNYLKSPNWTLREILITQGREVQLPWRENQMGTKNFAGRPADGKKKKKVLERLTLHLFPDLEKCMEKHDKEN